jgi:AraC-like DNA-binding protein
MIVPLHPRLESFEQGNHRFAAFMSRYPRPTFITPHFHPRLELVVFRAVAGTVHLPATQTDIRDDVVYLIGPNAVHSYTLQAQGAEHGAWIVVVDLDACAADLAVYGPGLRGAFLDRFVELDLVVSADAGLADAVRHLAEQPHSHPRQTPTAVSTVRTGGIPVARCGEPAMACYELADLYTILARSATAVQACRTLTRTHGTQSGRGPRSVAASHESTRRVISFIREQAHTAPSIDDIARHCAVSKYHLCRTFRQATGMTIGDYLLTIRLERACALLSSGVGVTAACQDSGFGNLSYFIQAFRKQFGVTPGAWAKGDRVDGE